MLNKKKQETIQDEEDGIQKKREGFISSPSTPRPWNESEKNVPRSREEKKKRKTYIYMLHTKEPMKLNLTESIVKINKIVKELVTQTHI